MRKKVTLVTGAAGEIGLALIQSRRAVCDGDISLRISMLTHVQRKVSAYSSLRTIGVTTVPSLRYERPFDYRVRYLVPVSPVHSTARIFKEG